MENGIFAYDSYKIYLRDRIRTAPRAGHGYRQRLAHAMQIQPTYLSQVLKGARDLNSDQTILLADFLYLNKDETEFLLLLVQRQRAGTVKSRQFFDRQIAERRDSFVKVKNRVKIASELSDEDKAIYYSDSLYGAVHMAVTIPELRTVERIAERLQASRDKIREITAFLQGKNLIERKGDQFLPSNTMLFVDKASPFIVAHHRNWRLKAMERAGARKPDDFQFSMGVTLSEKDAKLIRQKLAKLIEETAQQVKDSPSEKIMAFCLDFFEY